MGRPVLPETEDVLKWRHRADAKVGNVFARQQVIPNQAYRDGWKRTFRKTAYVKASTSNRTRSD